MTYSSFKRFGDRTIPATWTLVNDAKPGHRTEFEYLDVQFDVTISDRIFSFQELEQARERLRAELMAVIERLESVEKSIKGVEQMAMALDSDSRDDTLQQSMADVVGRINSLEEHSRSVSDSFSRETALMDDVERRIESLEAQRPGKGHGALAGTSALILSIGQLRDVIRQGRPFTAELSAAMAVATESPPRDAALDALFAQLQPYAETGVVTHATLRNSFSDMALAVLQADQGMDGDGWISQAINRLTSLVTVRRVDEDAMPDSADARIARAEADLLLGDLAAVVEVLSGLSEPAAVAAEPWLAQVRATLAVERTMTDLNSFVIAQLSAAQG